MSIPCEMTLKMTFEKSLKRRKNKELVMVIRDNNEQKFVWHWEREKERKKEGT